MKIRLTEGQYKRLLSEDTTSHEDWGRLSKTVDPFTIKIFNYIRKKLKDSQLKMNIDIVNFLTNDMQLTQEESIILTHNFKKMVNYDTMTEVDELMGEPLEYIRIWEIPTHIPTTILVRGRGYPMGIVYVLGKNTQDALKNVKDGNNFEIGSLYDDEIDLDDFDIEIDEIHPQPEMVSDDFYDGDTNDGKFVVKPKSSNSRLGYKVRLSSRTLESLISKIG